MEKALTRGVCIHPNCKSKAVKPHPRHRDDMSIGLCDLHYLEIIEAFRTSSRPILIFPNWVN